MINAFLHLILPAPHSVVHLHTRLQVIPEAIPKVQGSGAGLGEDHDQKPGGGTAFILQIPREPQAVTQGGG